MKAILQATTKTKTTTKRAPRPILKHSDLTAASAMSLVDMYLKRGATKAKIARDLGVSPSTIERWRTGKCGFNASQIITLILRSAVAPDEYPFEEVIKALVGEDAKNRIFKAYNAQREHERNMRKAREEAKEAKKSLAMARIYEVAPKNWTGI